MEAESKFSIRVSYANCLPFFFAWCNYDFLILQQLFDSLCSIIHDELLLLRTFDRTHTETCETVKAASRDIITSIEKFSPVFKNSKVCFSHPLFILCEQGHCYIVYTYVFFCGRKCWISFFLARIER